MVFQNNPNWLNHFYARIGSESISETVTLLEKKWLEFAPTGTFEYSFVDVEFDALYRAEQQTMKIAGYFAFLAILIACLGLFGLASYSTEQRTKEIGIRKVLGASVTNLISLVSSQFIKLVLIANVIAWPVAYIAMKRWLQDFAYHVDIGLPILAVSAILALGIALLAVSFQAMKAATSNPVTSIRYE